MRWPLSLLQLNNKKALAIPGAFGCWSQTKTTQKASKIVPINEIICFFTAERCKVGNFRPSGQRGKVRCSCVCVCAEDADTNWDSLWMRMPVCIAFLILGVMQQHHAYVSPKTLSPSPSPSLLVPLLRLLLHLFPAHHAHPTTPLGRPSASASTLSPVSPPRDSPVHLDVTCFGQNALTRTLYHPPPFQHTFIPCTK